MNIQVNSESEDDSILKESLKLQSKISNQHPPKKKGHFRGDSFGDSTPLENALSRKDINADLP
jgi:hypothetical protein